MNLAFISPLQHAGLALAIGLGACLNAGLLFYQLRSQKIYQPQPGWFIFFVKILLALAVMGIVLAWLLTLACVQVRLQAGAPMVEGQQR